MSLTKITPRFYSIARGSNIFFLKASDDELIIVDSGIPGSLSNILEAIDELGYRPHQVSHILVTHADVDHAGSLKGLKNATGAILVAGEKSRPYIESASPPPHLPIPVRWFAPIFQKLAQKTVLVDRTVTDGELLDIADGIRALEVPGHTPDNIAYFWEPERILIASDLLTRMGGTLRLTQKTITWDMDQAKASAKKVLALDPAIIGVGHGDAVMVRESQGEIDSLKAGLE